MKRDELIFGIIEKEHQRQLKGIELIASENFVSNQVMEAMGSCLTNKYAEGYPGKRYYGGCEIVDQSEQIAIDRLKQIFGAEWANVQPHSGAQANAAVFLAVLNPGDKFMGLNLAHGGHLSHGSAVNTSGILYTPCEYNLNKETGRVDYDQMEEIALREHPKMIIGGGSAYSREWDYNRMREIADKVGAIFMVDMAHPAGLIAAGLLDNPVKYAHIVTSTTHKTLRGPRGGVIMMGKDFPNPWGKKTPKGEIKMMSQLLDSAVFPGIQGGPLEHVIAAKAVAFGECLQPEYKKYQKQVQKNAKVLAQALMDRGFTIVSGGTDNHSMLVDLRTKYPELTGKVAEKALVSADITVNKNMVPFDTRSAFQTSGIRLGTPAITTRGAKEDLMTEIAEMIETVLSNVDNGTSFIENAASKLVMPIQNGLTYLKNKISGNDTFFTDINNLKQENEELSQKNSELEQSLRELESIRSENETLKEYLGLTEKYGEYSTVPAYIINKDINNYSKTIVINVGSDDGIKENMTVIADQGLVGHVISVTSNTAKVTTIIDTSSSVSCLLSTTDESIVCKGTSEEDSALKAMYIPDDDGIIQGDSVETSGLGGIYPKGIHVGSIKRVVNTQNAIDRYAIVETAVDFDKLDTVLVITNQ